jgi:uncharacterized protein (TIGR02246 family)
MRRLILVGVLAVVVSGCGGGGGTDAASRKAFAEADKYEIQQLQVKWHEAMSTKNLELATSLFADDAVFTVGGQTYRGREQLRDFFATKSAPFRPENNWISLHPAFKVRVAAVEDRGTIHFECHYVDRNDKQFKASVLGDARVARVNGKWLFTSLVGGNATL